MSNLAIDQLFQITSAAPSARDSTRANSGDGDLFRSHLDRAASTVDTKAANPPADDLSTVKEEEPIATESEQQEASTTEQEQKATSSESAEKTDNASENAEDQPSDDDSSDEVTLSAAAAQTVEVTADQAQATTAEVIVGATSNDQQNSGEQTSQQSTEPSAETAIDPTAETVEADKALLGEASPEGTTGEADEQLALTAAEANVKQPAKSPELTSVAGSQTASQETKKQQSPTTANNAQKSIQKQATSDVQQSTPESDATENTEPSKSTRFDTGQRTTPNELTNVAETELAAAKLNNLPEASTSAQNSSAPSSNSESVAAAGKALGNAIAGKSTSNANATTETSKNDVPTIDRARFVQRVGGAIRSAQQRDGQIQLRLSPPELGTLRIQLTVSEGAITAHLETETAAARTALLDNLPALRERLAEQEITIEKFDVDVGQDERQPADYSSAEERPSRNSQNQPNDEAAQSKTESAATPEAATIASTAAPNTGLDVRI